MNMKKKMKEYVRAVCRQCGQGYLIDTSSKFEREYHLNNDCAVCSGKMERQEEDVRFTNKGCPECAKEKRAKRKKNP